MLRSYGVKTGRALFSLAIQQVEELPKNFKLHSPHCVLMIVMDARELPDKKLLELARWGLGNGAVYVCAWGPDCERLHDLFDEVAVSLNSNETDDSVIITTWHSDESLRDAMWFAIWNAFPAGDYAASCRSVLILSIGRDEWGSEINEMLSNPEFLKNQ